MKKYHKALRPNKKQMVSLLYRCFKTTIIMVAQKKPPFPAGGTGSFLPLKFTMLQTEPENVNHSPNGTILYQIFSFSNPLH